MHTHSLKLTDANFESAVLQSDLPVAVDFWAAWCGPCRLLGPIVEELAADFAGRVTVAKLNIDDYPQLAGQYGIQALPTLLLFHQGQVVDQMVGVNPKPVLAEKLNALLSNHATASKQVA